MQPASWKDDRLSEMLWATLLMAHLPREQALTVFREVAKYIEELPKEENFDHVTHTGLSKLPSEKLNEVLSIVTARQEQRKVLVPLLLLSELPAREEWAHALGVDESPHDRERLMTAVGTHSRSSVAGIDRLPLA